MKDSDDDKNIINYKAKYLDKLTVTNSTIAYDSNFRMCYMKLSNNVKRDNNRNWQLNLLVYLYKNV